MLTQEDLLAPKGRVEGKSFFPDLSSADLAARLQEYLTQGYSRADSDGVSSDSRDDGAAHFAYYLVFNAVYMQMMANPISSTTTEGGSASFSLSQAESFLNMANEELDAYNDLVPVGGALVTKRSSATVALKNRYSF